VERPTTEETSRRLHRALDALDQESSVEVLSRLAPKIPGWLEAHFKMEHSFPSPSLITRCRLQLWFTGRHREPDQEIPAAWKLRRLLGILSEPLWFELLGRAGFEVDIPDRVLPCDTMIAHPDTILNRTWPTELKSTTGVGFKKLLEGAGVAYEEPGHYAQVQLEIHAAEAEWGLYIVWPPDPGLLQADLRRKKRYGRTYEIDPIYVEWVKRDSGAIDALLRRARLLIRDQEKDTPPPREYDGIPEDPRTGRKTMPCGYCQYLEACNDTYEYREGVEWDE